MRLLLSVSFLSFSTAMLVSGTVRADAPTAVAPPPDQKALVAAPAPVAAAPKIAAPGTDTTTATVSAGGQLATGNSRMLAATANAKFDMRRGANGFGAAIIGNYGESSTTPGVPMTTTTENFQGRLRYDRYVLDNLSIFLIGTVRHDKFQGLDGRLNVDPGLKYIFYQSDPTSFWAELGYDFQYDARNGSALTQLDASGNPIPGAPPLAQTVTDHSVRAFVGFKHAFNDKVTFVTGLEYLQSLYSSDTVLANASYDYRINYDALFAANVGGGFSLGLGFSARYDNVPLPGKQNTDTITTFNLIYAFSDIAAPAPAPTCPCPDPNAPPPAAPAAAPPPATAPVAAPPAAPAPAATTPATTPAPAAAPPATPQ
jgi:putative salt-induced outer membrane protein YdiY